MTKRFITYVMLMVGICLHANAAPGASDSIRVSLVTVFPGSEIYEAYGHTELRVVDERGDYFYNYGLFDFNSPGFTYRFVKGETDYLCGAIPQAYAMQGYDGRRVVEQVLNLTPSQARMVRDLLAENAKAENATYRYKFVSDNCATRPRDIIEKALGDSLEYHPQDFHGRFSGMLLLGDDLRVSIAKGSAGLTYRDIMQAFNANFAWSQFGIDLALGCDLDTVITYRQRMFAPLFLMDAVKHATVKKADGTVSSLVKSEQLLSEGSGMGPMAPPTPWYATPLIAALALLVLAQAMTVRDCCKTFSVSRWFDTVVYAVYALGGCLMFYLVFVSTHECTSPNYNALWLHPFYLLLAVLPWLPKAQRATMALHVANIVWLIVVAVLIGGGVLHQKMLTAFYLLMAVPILRSLNYLILYQLRHFRQSRNQEGCYAIKK